MGRLCVSFLKVFFNNLKGDKDGFKTSQAYF